MAEYNAYEMIAYTGSRLLEDKKVVFVGTGLPLISAMLAQHTHAPNIVLLFEAGAFASVLELGLPMSVGDTRTCTKACYLKGLCSSFELTQRGYADYGFIGGAQIDMYGNVNATVCGDDYNKPEVRFPGSGGAGAMAANCEKIIITMVLEKRRFCRQVDFVTSIGYGDGSPDYREKSGVMGSGPYRVITNQAIFGFDNKTKSMMLLEVAPGLKPDDMQDKVDFELIIPQKVKVMEKPGVEDLKLLREVIDPTGVFLERQVEE
ncbi:MAG: CoA-transferase [Chloroflexota bacterium]|nr:CoA-transferase [Chloroflexota bacterium]